MVVALEHFQSLRERFPDWPTLKAHLTSKEGGALRVVESEGSPYVVIRYTKGASDLSSPALGVGLFRSVVWDTVMNRPVCMAPAKAYEGHPPLNTNFASVEDFVDGCMIQAFVTAAEPTVLRLATRTQLDAQNRFYSSKTFAELFEECLASTPVRTKEALHMQLRERMDETGATAVFASMVLQHPEHRIVAKMESPDLFLVHVGRVDAVGGVEVWEHPTEWSVPLRRLQIPRYPVRQFHSEHELEELMRRTAVQSGFRWQGLVFKDGTGVRWRVRSPSYLMLRALRGSEAAPLERFLRLRREGKVVEYLKHYGFERQTFWGYEQTLRARTAAVLEAYGAVHKAHSVKFADLPAAYKPAVHLLHVLYLNELRLKKQTVLLRNAVTVVNGLREFEQRRLVEAEAVSFAAAATSVAVLPTEAPVLETD